MHFSADDNYLIYCQQNIDQNNIRQNQSQSTSMKIQICDL